LVLTGVERARIVPGITKAVPLDLEWYPISHSLLADFGWALLLAGIYFALQHDRRAALVLFAGVLSHWLLDFVSHAPDMPILPRGPKVGLGLWNYPMPAMCVEAALLAAGVWLYLSATRPRQGGGKVGLAIVIAVLFLFNLGAYLGPPPPNVTAPAAGNVLLIVLLWILHRVDRRREPA
jgi:hypothetical protein